MPADLDDMTRAEIDEYLTALRKLPPIGWRFFGVPKGKGK